MNYIVFDLEWNQCPGGKEKENKKLPFEIIQIGAVKLDDQWEECGQFQEKIRPRVYHSFHRHTQEVLHMDMKAFRKARPFYEVIPSFLEWCGPMEEAVFCSWGPQDLLELQRNMRFYHIKNPFPFPLYYLDIQKIFSLQREDGRSRKNLQSVVDALELPKDQPFHEALGDASYTAGILQTLDKEQALKYFSVDYYRTPQSRKEEFQIRYETYQKFVSKPFRTKTDAMRDRKVAATRCYICGKPARKKIRWFTGNSKNYYCLARGQYLRPGGGPAARPGPLRGTRLAQGKKPHEKNRKWRFFLRKDLKARLRCGGRDHHTEKRSPETKTETLQKRGMSLCPQRFFTFV